MLCLRAKQRTVAEPKVAADQNGGCAPKRGCKVLGMEPIPATDPKQLVESADLTGSACQNTLALLMSHISYSHSHISQFLTLISCILYLGGSLRGGLLPPPPNPAKLRFKPLMPYLITILYFTYYTILPYLWDFICSFAHTKTYLELSVAI